MFKGILLITFYYLRLERRKKIYLQDLQLNTKSSFVPAA